MLWKTCLNFDFSGVNVKLMQSMCCTPTFSHLIFMHDPRGDTCKHFLAFTLCTVYTCSVGNVKIITYSLVIQTTFKKFHKWKVYNFGFCLSLNCWTNCGCYAWHLREGERVVECMFERSISCGIVSTEQQHHFMCVIIVLIRLNHVVIWIYWVKQPRFKATHKHTHERINTNIQPYA